MFLKLLISASPLQLLSSLAAILFWYKWYKWTHLWSTWGQQIDYCTSQDILSQKILGLLNSIYQFSIGQFQYLDHGHILALAPAKIRFIPFGITFGHRTFEIGISYWNANFSVNAMTVCSCILFSRSLKRTTLFEEILQDYTQKSG